MYWIKWLHLFGGRLAISLVRNDAMGRGLHARFERVSDLGGFVTFNVGTIWLNVDWV